MFLGHDGLRPSVFAQRVGEDFPIAAAKAEFEKEHCLVVSAYVIEVQEVVLDFCLIDLQGGGPGQTAGLHES